MKKRNDVLQKLHTRVIDSRDGYAASRERITEDKSYVSFFDRRIVEREEFHTRLHRQMSAAGIAVDEDGSVAAAAHRGWLKLRDAITGGDDAVYDEVINGETALIKNYDHAIRATVGDPGYGFLVEQRAAVERAIQEAKSEKMRYAA